MPTMMQESTGSCNVSGWGTLRSGAYLKTQIQTHTQIKNTKRQTQTQTHLQVDGPQTSWWWSPFLLFLRAVARLSEIKVPNIRSLLRLNIQPSENLHSNFKVFMFSGKMLQASNRDVAGTRSRLLRAWSALGSTARTAARFLCPFQDS